jgi:hypothetical protein
MFFKNRHGFRNGTATGAGHLMGFILAAAVAHAQSYTQVAEGSTATHRSVTDQEFAQLNIYVGSSFPAGTKLVAFRYLFDLTTFGNTSGYITPLVFESKSVEAFTVYTVVGIGKGFEVSLSSHPQTIPFDVIEGTGFTTNGNFTFGFITAMVNTSGTPVQTSQGVVDYAGTYPDGGQGVGGTGTTNDWEWTVGGPPPVVALGTTFGLDGAKADYTLGQPYRTYSAQAIGLVAAP